MLLNSTHSLYLSDHMPVSSRHVHHAAFFYAVYYNINMPIVVSVFNFKCVHFAVRCEWRLQWDYCSRNTFLITDLWWCFCGSAVAWKALLSWAFTVFSLPPSHYRRIKKSRRKHPTFVENCNVPKITTWNKYNHHFHFSSSCTLFKTGICLIPSNSFFCNGLLAPNLWISNTNFLTEVDGNPFLLYSFLEIQWKFVLHLDESMTKLDCIRKLLSKF